MPRSLAPGFAPGLAAIGILAAMAGWLATASLQQDFAAYYTAGAAAARGLDPYVNHLPTPGGPWDGVAIYRHSRFLYPPLAAELFRPFAALPFALSKAIFTALSVVALLASFTLVTRASAPGRAPPPGRSFVWGPLLCVIWPPVFVALERGQMDPLLMVALAATWHWRDRPLRAGPLLAVAVLGKPLILGILPLLICARRPRLAASALGALALLGLAGVVISGPALSKKYVREVFPRAAAFGEGGPEDLLLTSAQMARGADDLVDGVARIDGVGRAYPQGIGDFRRNASLSRLIAGDAASSVLGAAGLLTFLVLGIGMALGALRSPADMAWFWGALVAAVVSAPVSWAMGLVWALPILLRVSAGTRGREAGLRDGVRLSRPRTGSWLALAGAGYAAGLLGPFLSLGWVFAGLAAVALAAGITIKREVAA